MCACAVDLRFPAPNEAPEWLMDLLAPTRRDDFYGNINTPPPTCFCPSLGRGSKFALEWPSPDAAPGRPGWQRAAWFDSSLAGAKSRVLVSKQALACLFIAPNDAAGGQTAAASLFNSIDLAGLSASDAI